MAERVEALALLGIPQRGVGRSRVAAGAKYGIDQNYLMPTMKRPSTSSAFSQYGFLANPRKINPVRYCIMSFQTCVRCTSGSTVGSTCSTPSCRSVNSPGLSTRGSSTAGAYPRSYGLLIARCTPTLVSEI